MRESSSSSSIGSSNSDAVIVAWRGRVTLGEAVLSEESLKVGESCWDAREALRKMGLMGRGGEAAERGEESVGTSEEEAGVGRSARATTGWSHVRLAVLWVHMQT
eukprot:262586_1